MVSSKQVLLLSLSAFFMLFAVRGASSEPESVAKPSAVRPAAFTGSAAIANAKSQRVTFQKRVPRVGDKLEQSLDTELRLTTTLRQGNQIGEKKRTTARSLQQRTVTTTHVDDGKLIVVQVQYADATKELTASNGTQPTQVDEVETKTQPVAGKTYICQREPGEDGKLVITDERGQIPPTEEYEIVAQQMEMVGRPNPLCEFLAGKTLSMGETIELPKEVASKVFNLGEQFGEVTKFALKLESLEKSAPGQLAVFVAHVEAASSNASQMRLELAGPLEVEATTCRAVKVDLTGPIAVSETRGSYSTSYQVIGTGQLKVNVQSAYRDVQRE
jgi:hypothetical protein